MTKIFKVVYSIRGQEKEVHFDYIPEEVSSVEIKLNNYLKKEISKQEQVEEEEIYISRAVCVFKI